MLPRSVYGLTELHRDEIAEAPWSGNPGCFAVSAILGAAPAVQEGLIDPDTIICDAKTGVSGAGIKPAQTFHYPLRYENMNAYKIAAHQHNFEIERELSAAGRRPNCASRLPPRSCRFAAGIMTTIYGQLADSRRRPEALRRLRAFYQGSLVRPRRAEGAPASQQRRARIEPLRPVGQRRSRAPGG